MQTPVFSENLILDLCFPLIAVSSHNVNMAEEEEVDMEAVMCAPGNVDD